MTITDTDSDTCAAASDRPCLPYWQDKPCPPWCRMAHRDEDELEDRGHQGSAVRLTLTMEEALVDRDPTPVVEPSDLVVYTVQKFREQEPHLLLMRDEKPCARLTLDEGRRFAEILADAVRQAERQPAAR
jgi:hypothetical protein